MYEEPSRIQEKPDVYIICPVRKLTLGVKNKIASYVANLESQGKKVHWPPRDTDQTDPVGMSILYQNRLALLKAQEVHIWYDPTSEGTALDIGMLATALFYTRKKVVIINNNFESTPEKSIRNIVLGLANRNYE